MACFYDVWTFLLFLLQKNALKTTGSVKNQGGPATLSPKIQGGPPPFVPPLKLLSPSKSTYACDPAGCCCTAFLSRIIGLDFFDERQLFTRSVSVSSSETLAFYK
jgi:hypothetical protein